MFFFCILFCFQYVAHSFEGITRRREHCLVPLQCWDRALGGLPRCPEPYLRLAKPSLLWAPCNFYIEPAKIQCLVLVANGSAITAGSEVFQDYQQELVSRVPKPLPA